MEKDYWYDDELEKKIIAFIEKLNLDKGQRGQKIKLLDFQKKIICDILCWKDANGYRKHREAFVFLPRKNGKSFLIACILVYSLFCDKEYGAEYLIVANSRDQANHLFDTVKNMIETNKTLKKHCNVVDSRKKITRKSTNSFLQVLSSDASKADGYNPYISVYDETHEAPNRRLYDKLKTGMGARKQPLMITITTASNGQDEANLEYTTYQYAKKVQSGEVKDDTFYSAIYEADDDCDILDEKQWYKANPALGIFRSYDELKALALRSKEIPSEESNFRRMYLNQHIRLTNEQAIRMDKWVLCGDSFDINQLKGLPAYCGLDLATTNDLTAFVLVIPYKDKYYVIPHFFKPSGTLLLHEKRDRVNYSAWSKQKWNGYTLLHATKGDYVSFRYVRQKINECAKEFDIKEIAFDRFGSQGIVSDLSEDGFTVVDFGQGYGSMSPAIKSFQELMLDQMICHGDNPILTWMAGNTVADENPAGDVKFNKAKSTKRIDGIIAMLMGLSRAVANSQSVDLNEMYTDEYFDSLGW